jgi:hypothetical protein
MASKETEHRWVTNTELKDALDERPTRYEMRFLILLAVIANSVLPTASIGQAATKLARHEAQAVVSAIGERR